LLHFALLSHINTGHVFSRNMLEGPRILEQKVLSGLLDVFIYNQEVGIDLFPGHGVIAPIVLEVGQDCLSFIGEPAGQHHGVVHQLIINAA
jgi:hypothetical protein